MSEVIATNQTILVVGGGISGMTAALYDADCSGEGGASAGRIMLMKHAFGIYVIRDGLVLDWLSCEGSNQQGG